MAGCKKRYYNSPLCHTLPGPSSKYGASEGIVRESPNKSFVEGVVGNNQDNYKDERRSLVYDARSPTPRAPDLLQFHMEWCFAMDQLCQERRWRRMVIHLQQQQRS